MARSSLIEMAKLHLLRGLPNEQQVAEMLEALGTYIKLAVDVQQRIVAGGGGLHADCEYILIEQGSKQADVWGADWEPTSKLVTFEALMNIRPRQNNPSMEILDPGLRSTIEEIVREIFEG